MDAAAVLWRGLLLRSCSVCSLKMLGIRHDSAGDSQSTNAGRCAGTPVGNQDAGQSLGNLLLCYRSKAGAHSTAGTHFTTVEGC